MRTLFISDLDGTLFNSKAEINTETSDIINSLIEKGMNFAFATARSVYSAIPMTEKININSPCILMNGVSVYDIQSEKYIKNQFILPECSVQISDVFSKHNIKAFLYKIENDVLKAYYTSISSDAMKNFADERRDKYKKPFVMCDNFKDTVCGKEVYFTTTGSYSQLMPVKEDIDLISNIDCAFYEDTYTKEWYLEVFSQTASKSNGIKFLRQNYDFDKIVCFGDNLNDIPMFRESDVRIAVANAKPELKKLSDFITLSNNQNGVAVWLEENYRNFL